MKTYLFVYLRRSGEVSHCFWDAMTFEAAMSGFQAEVNSLNLISADPVVVILCAGELLYRIKYDIDGGAAE